MKKKLMDCITAHHMISSGETIVVALSGGADSVSLLHFLLRLVSAMNLNLVAVHINHGLRGEESERDEQFCRQLCTEWGIPLYVERVDVRKEAAKTGQSIEMCGREIRYAFLKCIAKEHNNAKIATAHTLSDSIETTIMHMVRGTGLRGLTGIPPVRGHIIRPLICITRQEVEQYCKENRLPFVNDSSNIDRAYTRNRVRLDIVPQLYHMNPAFDKIMSRLFENVKADEQFLTEYAQKALCEAKTGNGYSARRLLALPSAIRVRAIRQAAEAEGKVIPEAVHIAEIEKILHTGGAVNIAKNLFAVVKNDVFSMIQKKLFNPVKVSEIPFKEGKTQFSSSKSVQIDRIDVLENDFFKKINKKLLTNCLDCDKIIGNIHWRSRVPGDFFHPIGRNCTKRIKSLFIEGKISADERDEIPILADASGIVWIYGFGADTRVQMTEYTKHIIRLEVGGVKEDA